MKKEFTIRRINFRSLTTQLVTGDLHERRDGSHDLTKRYWLKPLLTCGGWRMARWTLRPSNPRIIASREPGPGAEIAVVVSSGFGAVTVLLARVVLREAMTWAQWAGIVAIVGGVAVLSG